MEAVDREMGYDAHVECPLCREQGLVSVSGYVAHLLYFPSLDPPYRCTGIHGGLTETQLLAHGIDPGRPPDVLPAHEAGLDADPRH